MWHPNTFTPSRELSGLVGRPPSFIRKAICRGLLVCHQEVPGGTIYITLADWSQYLEATRSSGNDPAGRCREPRRQRRGGSRRRSGGSGRGLSSDPTSYAEIEVFMKAEGAR